MLFIEDPEIPWADDDTFIDPSTDQGVRARALIDNVKAMVVHKINNAAGTT